MHRLFAMEAKFYQVGEVTRVLPSCSSKALPGCLPGSACTVSARRDECLSRSLTVPSLFVPLLFWPPFFQLVFPSSLHCSFPVVHLLSCPSQTFWSVCNGCAITRHYLYCPSHPRTTLGDFCLELEKIACVGAHLDISIVFFVCRF